MKHFCVLKYFCRFLLLCLQNTQIMHKLLYFIYLQNDISPTAGVITLHHMFSSLLSFKDTNEIVWKLPIFTITQWLLWAQNNQIVISLLKLDWLFNMIVLSSKHVQVMVYDHWCSSYSCLEIICKINFPKVILRFWRNHLKLLMIIVFQVSSFRKSWDDM